MIGDRFAVYAQQQQQFIVSDPLSDSLQIEQSKVQSATATGAFGHECTLFVQSIHTRSIDDTGNHRCRMYTIICDSKNLTYTCKIQREREEDGHVSSIKMTASNT